MVVRTKYIVWVAISGVFSVAFWVMTLSALSDCRAAESASQ